MIHLSVFCLPLIIIPHRATVRLSFTPRKGDYGLWIGSSAMLSSKVAFHQDLNVFGTASVRIACLQKMI